MRIYDPRIAKFLSVDPLTKTYPWYTPYQFAGNTPIAAIDLDGEEPKIVVTNEVTGTTMIKVYGMGNVNEIIVRTYKAIIQYTDKAGKVTELGTFNVTRDGWFDMGTDKNGNVMLFNRSSDPINKDKLYIDRVKKEQYGEGTPSFRITDIDSPIPDKYNKIYDKGQAMDDLPADVIRDDGVVEGAEFHVGGVFVKIDGGQSLAGTYGCYGIVDPSQVSPKQNQTQKTSNAETARFGEVYDEANKMQIKEHGKSAKTEVEIQKRQHNKEKTVKKKS